MKSPGRKLAVIAAVVAFTTTLSGFFMGLRQTRRQAANARTAAATTWEAPPPTPASSDRLAAPTAPPPPAPRYADLPRHELQPNHGWQPHTDQLPRVDRNPTQDGDTLLLTASAQAVQRQHRAAYRAFDGAPPTVPHPMDQTSSASCLACHGNPVRVGDVAVAQISHPRYSQCLQCHAAGTGPATGWSSPPLASGAADFAQLAATNTFTGRRPIAAGSRAFNGAPPVIPHTTWMRDTCMSCHGPGGSSALRTSHLSRQSCTQCHATQADLDQRPAALAPFFTSTP